MRMYVYAYVCVHMCVHTFVILFLKMVNAYAFRTLNFVIGPIPTCLLFEGVFRDPM